MTDRTKVYILAALGIVAWLYVCSLLFGCRRPVPAREPAVTDTPWCFALAGPYRGQEESGTVCVRYHQTCLDARETARRFGAYRGVKEVGECAWRQP